MVKEEPADDDQNSNDRSSKSSKREAEKSPSHEEDGPSKPKKSKFNDQEKGREYECELCDCKFFTLAQYSCHIQSFEHRKRTILKMADKVFSEAPQYRGGREGDLPPGLSGRKVVHCKVCNVFTNSSKQLAEHLNGARHKQMCFKFNVPVTTLELTSNDTTTLEGTRLQGDKLMCKCCSVEINSMEQYKAHMASNKHKLVSQKKPLRPERKMKKALKPFYKSKKDDDDKEKSDSKTDKDKDEDKQKDKSKDKDKGKKDKEEGKEGNGIDRNEADSSAKVRDKYQLNLLDELHEHPNRRNEIQFNRAHRPMKDKKTIPKPVPYMCDICHVFGKSASELNEHLTSEGHKEALRKFLKSEKSPPAEDLKVEDKPTEVTDSEDKKPKQDKKNKTPELYCEVCQLLLPSLGVKREHENSKKHKFLQELRKKAKSEPHSHEVSAKKKAEVKKAVTAERTVPPGKPLHCSVCQMDLDTNDAMEEHIRSKKHKFLSELKPTPPAPVRRPEEGSRHKRAGPRDSGPDRHERRHGKRQSEEEEEIPELAAVALERRALQAQLAKRRQEIEEQHRLIAALREEQQLEAEKAALRRMIDECRRLIEEREKNMRRAAEAEERALRKAAKSVQWHPSVIEGKESRDSRQIRSHDYDEPHERLSLVKKAQEDWEREHLNQARSRSHAQQKHSVHVNREEDDWERDNPSGGSSLGYTSFSNWDGKIPLLDTAVETDDNATSWSASLPFESRESAPTFRNPLAGEDKMMNPFHQEPHFRHVDVGAVFSQETLGNSGANWPSVVHSPPVWSNISEESRDWNRPVLCTPPNSVALLGDKPGPMRDEPSPFGEKTSLLGSRPSLLEDRPSLLAEKPSLLGSRPSLLEDRPSLLAEKPSLLGSRPSLLEDRPTLLVEKPSLLGSRPSLLEDRPSIVEKPSLLGSRPSFVEDRLTLLVEKPNLGSRPGLLEDRPMTVEKPSLLGSGPSLLEDRPSLVTEKPSLLGSRPSLLEDKLGLLDGRPSFSGSRPVLLEDRPSILDGRPSLLEDRPGFHNDRPAFSAGRPGLLENRPSFLDGRPGFLGGRPSLLGDKPGLLGERPEQQSQLWGYSSQRPEPEPELWGGSSSVRIPGLDLV